MTGKVVWERARFGAGNIILAHDDLLILTEGGELILAPATPTGFHPVARAQVLGARIRAYPALARGYYIARDTRRVVCLDLRKR